jgi:hypothetical protein
MNKSISLNIKEGHMKKFQWLIKAGGCPKTALAALSLVVLLFPTVSGLAQTGSVDAKAPIKAWTGIWSFSDEIAYPKTTVEILPMPDGKGLQISRRAADQPEVKEVLIPDGSRQTVDKSNCTGWQSTNYIPEAGMIISSSEMNCKDTGAFTTVDAKLILNADQMVDILQLKAAGETRIAARRLTLQRDLPPSNNAEPVNAGVIARMNASQAWNLDTVIQLSKTVDAQVIEAALVEKRVVLDLNSKALKQLKNSKMPDGIIDLLVALAHPEKFLITQNGKAAFKPNVAAVSGNSGRLNTPNYSYSYVPSVNYYPGLFYNCYNGLYPNIYGGFSCYNYYSALWWDYPVYFSNRYNNGSSGSSGSSGSGVSTPSAGNNGQLSGGTGYVQIQPQPTGRHAVPRSGSPSSRNAQSTVYTPSTSSSRTYSVTSGGSYSGASSSSAGSSGSSGSSSSSPSSGGSSSAPSASPAGYSSGDSGGGRATPR